MSGLLSSPKVAKPAAPPPPPAPPTVDTSAVAGRQAEDELRRRKGTQSNIKSTGGNPITAAAQLLGS